MNEYAQNAVEQEELLPQEYILENEMDILEGIFNLVELKKSDEAYSTIEVRIGGSAQRRVVKYDDTPIPLKDGEKVAIKFRIRALDQEEYTKCREFATTYTINKKLGNVKTATDYSQALYFDRLIYTATHKDDKAKLWDNKQAWDKLKIMTGTDMVSLLLLFGEKNAIIDVIDEKSGFNDENLSQEEVSKKL